MRRALAAGLLLAAATPVAASGPYRTDDAAITPPGEGQVEAWVSLGLAGEIWTLVPAFTPAAVPWLELSLAVDHARLGRQRSTALGPQLKARLTPEPDAPS
ncbi:MAG: hypothetical protein ACK40H_01180, partial [Sphingomonadaceae bacterium]